MATDTTINNLIINKLTKAQYYDIENPSETEIYLVPDEIDDVPTENSVVPVKSGGVYTALAGKQNSLSNATVLTGITATKVSAWDAKQDALVSGTNIKTINNESILGEGNITIQGGSGSGDVNVIETVKVNGTALTPDANKAVDVSVPTALSSLTDDTTHRLVTDTEKTAWNGKAEVFIYDIDISTMPANGHMTIDTDIPFNAINAAFTAGKVVYVKITNSNYSPYILSLVSNYGGYYSFEYVTLGFAAIANIYPTFEEVFISEFEHYTKPSTGIPKTDLASAVQTSLGKADTALQSFTETDPTVPSWAKQSTKPTYTASEVGALPASTTIPSALADLSADSTHRVVTDTEKATWNAKGTYSKPSGGIPASDIASGVIPTVPTNVSAFTNDANYVSSNNIATIYSGSSAPSSSLGNNGDIYIQTS